MSSEVTEHASATELELFAKTLMQYIDAGAPILQVTTNEYDRTTRVILEELSRRVQLDTDGASTASPAQVWSPAEGMVAVGSNNINSPIFATEARVIIDPVQALMLPWEYLKHIHSNGNAKIGVKPPQPLYESGNIYIIYVGLRRDYFELPNVQAVYHTLANYLPSTNIRLILVGSDYALPEEMPKSIVRIQMRPPAHQELDASFRKIAEDLIGGGDVETRDMVDFDTIIDESAKYSALGVGMTRDSFEHSVAVSIVKAYDEAEEMEDPTPEDLQERIMFHISDSKREIVNKSNLLEFMPRDGRMDSVGGMNLFKDWIARRKECHTPEALAAGIRPPKGVVLVGVPGTGKSLVAKAAGHALGVPVVRLDIGNMFNSLLGASEQRMRDALKLAEDVAPCLLLVDEVDKALGGIGGSSDSGVSSRLFGTFLTWLQENKKQVFTMVTANSIANLPPELTRRGRFDAIFSVLLPEADERYEVLDIHLRKRGYDIADIIEEGSDEHLDYLNISDGYVPSEIESALEDALVNAFHEGVVLEYNHIAASLTNLVPMSKTYKDKIDAIVTWAKDNAMPVSGSVRTNRPARKEPTIAPAARRSVARRPNR